ncbi:MAG: hypothetical protein JRH16_10815 [Deltaproteobacteria bacterium]|nr:hypothetical protein [Deltaproteobacteria bacterium]MBW2360166.1 hypothetical protein [Deltaproteobacteria bacterium]
MSTPHLGARDRRLAHAAALPLLAVPVGTRDVVRAAFAWNLVVEIARLGASATLLAPRSGESSALWPADGPGPVGSSVALVRAENLKELHRAALDIAVTRAADVPDGGIVVVCVPPQWLRPADGGRELLRWVLLFSSTDRRDLLESYSLAKQVLAPDDRARVGIAIHGARSIDEARHAFDHLADVAQRHLDRPLDSYGLLVDDLHVYRAIVSRRPIGIEHPQSPAARALRDVAQMVLEDARTPAVA